jgi:glucose-6-phosphate 1-dehydrogenase
VSAEEAALQGDSDRLPSAAVIVVYGVTGDLARRMVLPALYDMARCGLLPTDTASSVAVGDS